MAYRWNGIECDSAEEVLKLVEQERINRSSQQIRIEHAEQKANTDTIEFLVRRHSLTDRQRIKTLIVQYLRDADFAKVSDNQLSKLFLADHRINIARRTLQKYRAALGLSSSCKRGRQS